MFLIIIIGYSFQTSSDNAIKADLKSEATDIAYEEKYLQCRGISNALSMRSKREHDITDKNSSDKGENFCNIFPVFSHVPIFNKKQKSDEDKNLGNQPQKSILILAKDYHSYDFESNPLVDEEICYGGNKINTRFEISNIIPNESSETRLVGNIETNNEKTSMFLNITGRNSLVDISITGSNLEKKSEISKNEVKSYLKPKYVEVFEIALQKLSNLLNDRLWLIFEEEHDLKILTNPFVNIPNEFIDLKEKSNLKSNLFRSEPGVSWDIHCVMAFVHSKCKQMSKTYSIWAESSFFIKLHNKKKRKFCDSFYPDSILIDSWQYKTKSDNFLNLVAEEESFSLSPAQIADNIHENLIIYKTLDSIYIFFKMFADDNFVKLIFPEMKIISDLYDLNMENHLVNGRKWITGGISINLLGAQITQLKEGFEKRENNAIFLKRVLEIRIFYFLNFLKFLNIKKIYLILYVLKSMDDYEASIPLQDYCRQNGDFEYIFNSQLEDAFNYFQNYFLSVDSEYIQNDHLKGTYEDLRNHFETYDSTEIN